MVLEQFLTLSDGCCIFWRQLADDGFDFLENVGVEQSCIIQVPQLVSTGSGGGGTSRETSFQIMMREGGFYKDPLHSGDKIIDLWKHFADRFTDTMKTMGQTSDVKECGVEDLQFLA